jgi:hypothetical protein
MNIDWTIPSPLVRLKVRDIHGHMVHSLAS